MSTKPLKGENPKEHRNLMVEQIIEKMKAGTAPWQKPWTSVEMKHSVPQNGATKRRYSGINSLYLMIVQTSMNTQDGRWYTFKQAKELGYEIIKGSKAQWVVYAKPFTPKDENGNPQLDENGREKIVFSNRWFPVFHASNFIGVPELELENEPNEVEISMSSVINTIIENGDVDLEFVPKSPRAYFNFREDRIVVPDVSDFISEAAMNETIFHELSHWTGHSSRLNRNIDNAFGTKDYAAEELVAEISSMFVSQHFGLPHNPHNVAAYVSSWSKGDEDKVRAAISAASKAADKLISLAENAGEQEHLVAA